jgi:Fur family peroxide stress response transcriptional regulator
MIARMKKGINFEAFQSLCKESGLAATHQRYAIYQAVVSLGDNPTPEEVFEHVRATIPSISLATVYKNIDTFVDHSMIRDITPNYGSRRIEEPSKPHDHFVCRNCRRVFDLPSHIELAPPPKTYIPSGAKFEYHLVELVGLCRQCVAETRDKRQVRG